MSKRHGKISLILIGFLLTLSTILSFAEPPEAPNQLITENPYKEVKTVEANKNREHAEMNISVDKLNLLKLDGYKIGDTEYYIELPPEEKLKKNETYYISKDIENLPNIYSVNGKKTITNLNGFKDYSIETVDFSYGFTDNFILIDRAPIDAKSFIVSKLDKSSGEIKKVYEVKNIKNTDIIKLSGEVTEKADYVTFNLSDDVLEELNSGADIKVGKNFTEILKTKNFNKRSRRSNKLFYKVDHNKKQLLVENRGDINEIKILSIKNKKINKIYAGNIFFKPKIEVRSGAFRKYAAYRRPKLLGQADGSFIIQFGEFVRANLLVGPKWQTDDSPSANPQRLNFFVASNKFEGIITPEAENELFGTDVRYRLFSNNSMGIETTPKFLYKPNRPLFGIVGGALGGSDIGSYKALENQSMNMFDGTRLHGRGYYTPGRAIGWAAAWVIQIKLTKSEYNEMRKNGYNKIRNESRIIAKINSLSKWNPPVYTKIDAPILSAHEINSEFDESQIPPIAPDILKAEGTVELSNPIIQKTNTEGGVLVYSNNGSLSAQTLGKVQNIKNTFGETLQFRAYLGYLGSNYVNIFGNVLQGNGVGKNSNNLALNLGNTVHLEDTSFVTGSNELSVSYPNSNIPNNKNGVLIGVKKWDLKAGEYEVKLDHPYIKNTIKIKLPQFDASAYYDSIPNKEIVTSVQDRVGNEIGRFRLATKDYNTDIFGMATNIPDATKFSYKIKKNLLAKVSVNGEIKDTAVTVKLGNIKDQTTLVQEDNENYYIYTRYGATNHDIGVDVILETEKLIPNNQIIEITVPNMVTLGIEGEDIGRSEVINKITIKETIKVTNFNEIIDVSNASIAERVHSKNGYDGLFQNEYMLILKDGNKEIFKVKFEELMRAKQDILEAGVNIRYNHDTVQNANKNQFEFEKVRGIDYNKTLQLEIYMPNGRLVYCINFNIINKAGFEILPGKGVLDFGDFFPGDIKKSESLIEFKNPNGAKIDVSLNPTNTEKMFKVGVNITPDTTIPLSNIQIKDLKTESNHTNSFRISGEAKTTPKTEIGEYKGELEVIITVIP